MSIPRNSEAVCGITSIIKQHHCPSGCSKQCAGVVVTRDSDQGQGKRQVAGEETLAKKSQRRGSDWATFTHPFPNTEACKSVSSTSFPNYLVSASVSQATIKELKCACPLPALPPMHCIMSPKIVWLTLLLKRLCCVLAKSFKVAH